MNPNPVTEPAEEDVQKEAYLLYLASGCVRGRDLENWLAAREKIAVRRAARNDRTIFGAVKALHFPLNSNVSRSPFGSVGSFGSRN